MKRKAKLNRIFSIFGFLSIPIIIVLTGFALKYIFNISVLPSPSAIFSSILSELQTRDVWIALWNTISYVLVSALCAFIAGVSIGFIISRNDKVWLIAHPSVDFFRSIPVTFIIPLAALLLGGSTSKLMIPILAFYPALLIMILQVRAGVAKQSQERLHSFIVINGNKNKWETFWNVTFFESLPEILTGFRITISYCIVVVTVLEYSSIGPMGNRKGLGFLIYQITSDGQYTTPKIYAYTILVGLVGFLLNKLIEIYQYKLVHWVKPIK